MLGKGGKQLARETYRQSGRFLLAQAILVAVAFGKMGQQVPADRFAGFMYDRLAWWLA
jgi:hypothetical protein